MTDEISKIELIVQNPYFVPEVGTMLQIADFRWVVTGCGEKRADFCRDYYVKKIG